MYWKRISARGISELSSLTRNSNASRPGLRILLYHSVGSTLKNNFYGISVATTDFERHMRILSMRRKPVKLEPYQFPASACDVAVTFDDGYKDNLHAASPILIELKIPFTVFVTVSFIGAGQDYLTASELRELADLPGVTIGSHSSTHRRLAECDDKTLWRELTESRDALQQLIGKPVTSVSYPHGSVDARVRDAADRAGYTLGATSRFGINTVDEDPLRLHRIEIVARDTERVFSQKIAGHWDWRGRLP